MSFNTRIIIQLIISIILAQLISIFTYQFVSKINSKNIYFGILRLNDFEKTSAYKDKTLAPKIGIFTYEVRDEIIYNVKRGINCSKLYENKTILDLREDPNTQYFEVTFTSTGPENLMKGCFDEFLASVNKKYYNWVDDIEENFKNEIISTTDLDKIYEENFKRMLSYDLNNNDASNEMAKKLYLEKFLTLIEQDEKRIDFENNLKNLKLTEPIEIIRTKFSQKKFGKIAYSFSLTFIIFFIIFITSRSSQFIKTENFDKFKKSIGLN